jgi:predicted lipid-binding transport protein (Tim44 family)/uncharacterized tellurite resistance protein B-like protein
MPGMRMKRQWFWRVILILVIGIGISSQAFGRAGGGGHFSGGGGGGGGGHSFGGGGGGGFHSTGGGGSGRSAPMGPGTVIVIFIIVLIIVIFIIAQKVNEQRQAATIRQGVILRSAQERRNAEEELKARDPTFNPDRFYARVRDAFVKIQAAWCGHDLSAVRAFLSDGVIERFSLQIQEQQALGVRDQMDEIRISEVGLDDVWAGDVFESATVRIAASAIDHEVSLADGRHVSGSREREWFVEYWTFIRRVGAASVSGKGLIEGNCPNCGASIEMNQNAKCAHCQSLLKSGQYDWVLCEITQESEYRGRSDVQVRGMSAMREIDPELTADELEDRASVLFWRWLEAARLNDVKPLRKVATEDYCVQFSQKLRAGVADETRSWFGECGVGAVDTAAVVHGDDRDRALVVVTWSGSRFVERTGERPKKMGESPVMRTTLVLARKSGVKSSADRGISSAHCPNCGGPETKGESNACEFCGTVLNDGSSGWVLNDVQAGTATKLLEALDIPKEEVSETAGAPSAAGVLAWMVQMAASDGQIDEREKRMLIASGAQRKLPPDRVEGMIAAMASGGMQAPEPRDREEAMAWLRKMAGMALADGTISKEEAYLLRKAGARLGYGDSDLKMMLKQKRSEMLEQARNLMQTNDGTLG